jgi:hypothetical protein
MTAGKWGDAAGKPDPKQARAQGFEGLMLYFGTPWLSKNCTAAYYRAVRAAGLGAIGVVEHDQHDAELGASAGASYGQAGLADMAAQGAIGIPLGVTADEHLTAGQISTAIAFQAAASKVIRAAGRRAMGYGFSEFIHALRPGKLVDIEWQAGARSLVDSLTHIWQDNTGTEMVGRVIVDRDWLRRPLPGGDMLDPANPSDATVIAGAQSCLPGVGGQHPAGDLFLLVYGVQQQLAALDGSLSTHDAAILAAVQAADTDTKTGVAQMLAAMTSGGVDPKLFADALAPLLAPLLSVGATPAQIGDAVVDALEARLAAIPAAGGAA